MVVLNSIRKDQLKETKIILQVSMMGTTPLPTILLQEPPLDVSGGRGRSPSLVPGEGDSRRYPLYDLSNDAIDVTPPEQTDAYENITFPKLYLKTN